jgi:hypothetical protein
VDVYGCYMSTYVISYLCTGALLVTKTVFTSECSGTSCNLIISLLALERNSEWLLGLKYFVEYASY